MPGHDHDIVREAQGGDPDRPFIQRLLPAPSDGGFRMRDHWIWCGSVIRGDDERYHMFASRWSHELRFPHWLTNSEVVRAVADRPEGPYKFAQIVLPARGERHWDGRATHNPTIHRLGDTYLLFYVGSTYVGRTPSAESQVRPDHPRMMEARANQRIGLATARSVDGPWRRLEAPLISPRPGRWDALMTNNPAPCVLADGSVLLVYKSTRAPQDLLRLGVVGAPTPHGPYRRLRDSQLFQFPGADDHVEDAYVWFRDGRFELVMKDINGGISGEKGAGVHATSGNGTTWRLSDRPKAYSRTIEFDSGQRRTFGRVERPQLLVEDGRPQMLFVAIGETGPDSRIVRSWNQAIPIDDTYFETTGPDRRSQRAGAWSRSP